MKDLLWLPHLSLNDISVSHNKTLFHYLCCLKHRRGKQSVGSDTGFPLDNDGLGIMKNMSGPEIEQKRKQIIKYLKTVV